MNQEIAKLGRQLEEAERREEEAKRRQGAAEQRLERNSLYKVLRNVITSFHSQLKLEQMRR